MFKPDVQKKEESKKEVKNAEEVLSEFESWAYQNAKTNEDANFVKSQLERIQIAQAAGDENEAAMARGQIVSIFEDWKNNIYKNKN
jgi:hypothetical protein